MRVDPGIVNIDADAEVFQFGDHVNDARIAQVGAVLLEVRPSRDTRALDLYPVLDHRLMNGSPHRRPCHR